MDGKKDREDDRTVRSDSVTDVASSFSDRIFFTVLHGDTMKVVVLHAAGKKLIGRSQDADLSFDDAKLSRHHAELRRIGNKVLLTDLGSTNGTHVNGKRIEGAVELFHGDEVVAGNALIIVNKISGIDDRSEEEEAAVDAGPHPRDEEDDVVFRDPAMVKLLGLCDRIADSQVSVLIMGETGVGKEVVARYIHRTSSQSKGPFVAVNCAAIPDHLAESELFGYEKGAFTGAAEKKTGFIEAAEGGTLFLDEVGDLPLHVQPKLLRFFDRKSITRLGSTAETAVHLRIIGATNKDLEDEVEKEKLRHDLYYRISEFSLYIPPLRTRPSDILAVTDLIVARLSRMTGKPLKVSDQARMILLKYPWPGNVRQLKNVLGQAALLGETGDITDDLLGVLLRGKEQPRGSRTVLATKVQDLEKKAILDALEACTWNRAKAARILGISRRQLVYKMAKYDIAAGDET